MIQLYSLILGSALLVSCSGSKIQRNSIFGESYPIPPPPGQSSPATASPDAGAASAEPVAHIYGSGIFQGMSVPGRTRVRQPGTAAGYTRTLDGSSLVESTSLIPGKVGTSFGFRFGMTNIPIHGYDSATIRVIHPPTRRAGSPHARTIEEWPVPMTRLARHTALWTFDHEDGIAPGTWTMQLLYRGRIMAEKHYTVVKASMLAP